MSNLTLIIPAKNEKESLPKVLDELREFDFKINILLESSDKLTIESVKNYDWGSNRKQSRGIHRRTVARFAKGSKELGIKAKEGWRYMRGNTEGGTRKRPYTSRTRKKNNKRKKTKRKRRKH